jgi:hypothetical protein
VTPDPVDDPEITEVRRLLAEARHTEPIPPDVAARMEGILAGLRLPDADSRVVPIAAHRRRRVGALLVAAAAVVVGAVTLGPHLPSGSHGSSGSAAGTAADSATEQRMDAGAGSPAPSPQLNPSAGLAPEGKTASAGPRALVRDGRLVVSQDDFAADAQRGRRLLTSTRRSDLSTLHGCARVPTGSEALPATYRGAPAALVFRAPQGSSQVVDLYVCGSRDPVRSTTLTTP